MPPARRWSTATRSSCCATPRRTTPPGSRPSPPPSAGSTSKATSFTTTTRASEFAEALIARAQRRREGPARLRLGGRSATPPTWMFWERLRDGGRRGAGVQSAAARPAARVDLARPPQDARSVDGRVAFVTGLCVGEACGRGDRTAPNRGATPASRFAGPAVADVEAAFAEYGRATGTPLPPDESRRARGRGTRRRPSRARHRHAAGEAGMLRLDQLVAGLARKRAVDHRRVLRRRAGATCRRSAPPRDDGVDVRLLVPAAAATCRWCRTLSRAGYRGLLEAGVRVFEWNGTMVHAKTAVADGQWARVGLDQPQHPELDGQLGARCRHRGQRLRAEMERMFEADLERSTESGPDRPDAHRDPATGRRAAGPKAAGCRGAAAAAGRTSRAAAGAFRIGNTVGAALTARRPLGAAEASTLGPAPCCW